MSERLRNIAKKGREDYFYFAKNILGYSRMEKDPHQDLCDHILRPGKRKKLTLMPRNSFKSSVVTVGGTMFKLLQNPNLRVMIASETQKNAIKYVKEIKAHYEGNAKFRALYGDWVNVGNTWRDGEIIVSKRTAIKKESTFTAGSMEKGVATGMHFDLIVLDDPVSRSNTQNPDQIAKTLDFYRLVLSILDPNGEIWVNGTRWHYLDLYGWLSDAENPESSQFHILVRSADDGVGQVVGNPLMEKILPKAFLEEQMGTQGESIYSHQYRNVATSTEEQAFRPDQIQFYEKSPQGLYYFMTVDPAISMEAEADGTGLIVNGCDYKHDWWIQEAVQKQLRPSEILDLIFEFAQKYQPMMCIGMQKFAIEKMLKVPLDDEMKKRKIFIPIKDIPTDNRVSKQFRIRGLQPRFQARQIHLKKEHRDLYHQIVMFPQVKHDDVLDALQEQLQITFPSDIITEQKAEPTVILNMNEERIWKEVADLGKRRVIVRREQEA